MRHDTDTAVLERESTTAPPTRYNHIVEMIGGKPADNCLCGYLWDRLPRIQDAPMCDECVAEFKRRQFAL